MSQTFIKITGQTEKEATDKARLECKNLGIMRQPQMSQPQQKPDGTWVIQVVYWGLD
jgi:hypothetical protein